MTTPVKTAADASPRIEIRELAFTYDSGLTALEGVSLDLFRGERAALIGHNGSGKTTLAKHLNGLLRPSRGRIRIQGVDTAGESTARLAARTALLFQNPDDQICRRCVRDEVAFGPENLGFPPEKIERLVRQSLTWFDLLSRERENPHDLGYSERKRLALASVTAMDTPVVVLDEPTAGLDPHEICLLTSALDRLTARGKTILVITHDMDFAAEHLARAICLSGGRIVFDGRTEGLFANDALLDEAGLLPPQMVRLSTRFNLTPKALTPEDFVRRMS